jgi:putative membrane protein
VAAFANELRILVITVVYAVIGAILLYIGYRVFDWLTPTNLQADIFEKGNVAVAILAGAFILALAIVIGSAIHG